MENISDSQKIFEVSKIWKEASYNFVFWDKVDINWDEEYKKALERVLKTKNLYEYYRELARFVTLLGDGHTGVIFPNEWYQDPEYFSMIPVILKKIGTEIVVIDTTEEMKKSVPLYSVLKKINNVDIDVYVRENCYPYIWHENEASCAFMLMNEIMFGLRGSTSMFTFEKDGQTFNVQLERTDPAKLKWCDNGIKAKTNSAQNIISSSNIHKVFLQDDIAVIKMITFGDDSLPEKIYECFDKLKEAKGFIIDVRGNGGGNSSNGDAIAALFIKETFKSCFAETQIYEPTYKAWSIFRDDFKNLSLKELETNYADDAESIKTYRTGRNMFYNRVEGEVVPDNAPGKLEGPVVVLMDENTFSAAEDFIDVMKMYTKAIFIGENTAGSSGQPLFEQLESGGSFRICTRRCIAQNGEDIYNKGFAPDIKITQTLEDFIEGRDVVFEKALEIIKNKLKK